MPTINQLSGISQVSGGDLLPVYVSNNGDARKVSITQLLQYFQQTFASPTVATNLYTPGTGFNITVPTPTSEQQWMILQPAGTLASGTITLPLNTGVPDGTQVLITSTQIITSFTIALNGAAAVYGGITTLNAGAGVVYRFYQATNSWYNVSSDSATVLPNLTVTGLSSLQGVIIGDGNGTNNYAIGNSGNLLDNTTGSNNVAIGATVLANNTTGDQNVGIGSLVLVDNLTGDGNLAIGFVAQRYRTSGDYNVGLGDNALSNNVSGSYNTAVGAVALINATTSSNTAVGYRSGYLITSGEKNTILGRFDGNQGGLDIRTASNYIVLSDGDGNPRAYWNGADATFNGGLKLDGLLATNAAATTIASASTIAPTKGVTFISGTAAVVTITPDADLSSTGGTITLIPTGAFTWTTAGNIAVAGTAVVSRALTMTYDSGTSKWYPSYV